MGFNDEHMARMRWHGDDAHRTGLRYRINTELFYFYDSIVMRTTHDHLYGGNIPVFMLHTVESNRAEYITTVGLNEYTYFINGIMFVVSRMSQTSFVSGITIS